MKILKIDSTSHFPQNFTGIMKWPDGDKFWLQNGLIHRIDGPAVEFSDKEKGYHILGEKLTKEEFRLFQIIWERTLLEKTDNLMRIFIKLVKAK